MKKFPIILLISLAFIVGIGTNIFINSSGEPQITETESKSATDMHLKNILIKKLQQL